MRHGEDLLSCVDAVREMFGGLAATVHLRIPRRRKRRLKKLLGRAKGRSATSSEFGKPTRRRNSTGGERSVGARVRCSTRNGHDWADRFPGIVGEGFLAFQPLSVICSSSRIRLLQQYRPTADIGGYK
jgi:hypothetical protein